MAKITPIKPKKRSEFPDRFTVAMSAEDGCLVMIRNGQEVVGSMDRAQSTRFAKGFLEWTPVAVRNSAGQ